MSKNAETLKETQSSKLGISDVLRSFYEYHWKRTDVVEKFYDYHWYNTIKIAYNVLHKTSSGIGSSTLSTAIHLINCTA